MYLQSWVRKTWYAQPGGKDTDAGAEDAGFDFTVDDDALEPEPELNSDLDAFFGSVAVAEGAGNDFTGDDDDFEPEPLDA